MRGILKIRNLFFAAVIIVLLVFSVIKVFGNTKENVQPQIAEKILRFHVIANSDDCLDQSVKLKVRDGVLEFLEPKFEGCENKSDCEAVVIENIDGIKSKAEEILENEGFDEEVLVSLKERYFPVKQYGQYTFPQGNYEALCVEIGEAKGKNWWCVLYPRLCFVDSLYAVVPKTSETELKNILNDEEYRAIFNDKDTKIEVKSKLFEWIKGL